MAQKLGGAKPSLQNKNTSCILFSFLPREKVRDPLKTVGCDPPIENHCTRPRCLDSSASWAWRESGKKKKKMVLSLTSVGLAQKSLQNYGLQILFIVLLENYPLAAIAERGQVRVAMEILYSRQASKLQQLIS